MNNRRIEFIYQYFPIVLYFIWKLLLNSLLCKECKTNNKVIIFYNKITEYWRKIIEYREKNN